MKPLRLAFLWHQHQPYYRMGDSFILPWVRLHAVKDYTDLLLLFEEFPAVRHTVNVVPSLLLQLEEYSHGIMDQVQELTLRTATSLTDPEKQAIARLFLLCNAERMIAPYPRYAELANAIHTDRWHAFAASDWLDLQVWYLLTWIGPISRTSPEVAALLRRGRGFTEADKSMLLRVHEHLMAEMVPTLKRLHGARQIEISVTPYMHPILPLLCDTDVAVESRPATSLPSRPFRWEIDAHEHVRRALSMFEETFGYLPNGMWPAEGSVSTQALGVIHAHGVRWVATDEAVLKRSTTSDQGVTTQACFAWSMQTSSGEIGLLFRDHALSDAIGFEYQRWDADAASTNFLERLDERRRAIVVEHGEQALDHAVVPVILDGENCWEFYTENGAPFLRSLLGKLSTDERFVTVTCSEATADEHRNVMPTLERITAGSWIDGNFDIWIGSPEKDLAWELLADARSRITTSSDHAPAYEALLIAEGSDWFWWYDERHQAPNKYDFDILFRHYLKMVYRTIGVRPPIDLDHSLYEHARRGDQRSNYTIPVSFGMTAMHIADVIAREIHVRAENSVMEITLTFNRAQREDEDVIFEVNGNRDAIVLDGMHTQHRIQVTTGERMHIVVTEHRPQQAERRWTYEVVCP